MNEYSAFVRTIKHKIPTNSSAGCVSRRRRRGDSIGYRGCPGQARNARIRRCLGVSDRRNLRLQQTNNASQKRVNKLLQKHNNSERMASFCFSFSLCLVDYYPTKTFNKNTYVASEPKQKHPQLFPDRPTYLAGPLVQTLAMEDLHSFTGLSGRTRERDAWTSSAHCHGNQGCIPVFPPTLSPLPRYQVPSYLVMGEEEVDLKTRRTTAHSCQSSSLEPPFPTTLFFFLLKTYPGSSISPRTHRIQDLRPGEGLWGYFIALGHFWVLHVWELLHQER
ncbi:hypothetical protein B0T17DRAFT_317515 [Bombardia bombarda]|uniref:Uncharacterized protein n=1 Tax=Bombardia bombarda TaxID=252184 RepID=A0AA39WM47_9PEZI|nr:hypothetical protein B0T17DRAFT_317515 [Bombardia bombarda]